LRVHNNEANYFIALARSTGNIKMKIFYIAEYLKYKAISKRIFSKIDRLLFISYDEYRASLQLWGKDKCLFFPAALEEEVAGIITESSTEVLFIGNLFADNNIDGLRWYLDNVHSLVSTHKGYRLIIAGNTRGAGVPWLRKYLGCFDNIEFIDTPYDLMPLYNRSRVFVNPIRYGAGVKIKNLTALWNGLAVVSTPVGNEGTGLQHNKDVLLAHSAVDFAEKIIQLLDDNELRIRLTNSAQKFLQLGYNQKNNLSQVLTSARTTK
jgi:glycosyltransferase involved in cell wall biosynthesis